MASRKARAPQRDDAGRARKVKVAPQQRPSSPTPQLTQHWWSIYIGRDALGTVREVAGSFVATNASGRIIGTFASLREAARALPGGGAP